MTRRTRIAGWANRQSISRSNSTLATRAEVRTPLSDDNTLNQCIATAAQLAFLVIDAHVIIVLACLTPQVPIIVKGCPSMLYTQSEHGNDPFMQQVNFARGQAISSTRWMNTGIVKRFVSIDI